MTNKKLPSTSEFIKKYGLDAKKSLGQNFILDKNFTDKIAKSALENSKSDFSNEIILEIGPGPASLTKSILDLRPKILILVEKDRRCIEILNEIKEFYHETQIIIINKDALEINEQELLNLALQGEQNGLNKNSKNSQDLNDNIAVKGRNLSENSIKNCQSQEELSHKNEKIKVISNLPYNIGTALLLKWLKKYQIFSSLTLMLQKEVAQRIAAQQGDKNYSRISIICQLLSTSKILFEVNKNIFTPPPKVTSAIIKINPCNKPVYDIEISKLEKTSASAFNQKRKMIKSSLKKLRLTKNLEEILSENNINPQFRAQELSLEDFCNIAKYVKNDI